MASVPKVLIVEDEQLIAEYFRIVVEQLGYRVCGIASSATQAIALASREKPSVIFMDVRLSDESDGVDAARDPRPSSDADRLCHRVTRTADRLADQGRLSVGNPDQTCGSEPDQGGTRPALPASWLSPHSASGAMTRPVPLLIDCPRDRL